jgi:hypothetical protein
VQQFLRENGLQLVIRSHEGPDARVDRDDMPPMTPGYSTDHITESEHVMLCSAALQPSRLWLYTLHPQPLNIVPEVCICSPAASCC